MKKFRIIMYTFLISLFLPCIANALVDNTGIKSINETSIIDIENFEINNINFKTSDRDAGSTYFVLQGDLVNDYSNKIKFSYQITYYGINKEVLYEINAYEYYDTKSSFTFIKSYNSSTLNGKTVNDIYYYSMGVEINKIENEEISNTINGDNELLSTKISSLSRYAYEEYVIDNYKVDIIVNEDNSFDITETITTYFNQSKHGIYRKIPLKNTVARNDGTSSKNSARISNVKVNKEFSTSREDGYYVIKIGSADYTVIGEQSYVINYTYSLGKDPLKGKDELYYNLIGTEWDAPIGGVTFKITMPKDFDKSKLGFTSGSIGSTDTSNVNYNVNGNVITGSYDDVLDVGEGLTIRLELEEDYFKYVFKLDFSIVLMIVVPLILLIISWLLWYFFGKEKHVVETVEFYPPEDFNSLEIGFLYKGKATKEDVVSLMIYLANKGYIKITEIEDNSLFVKQKSFKLTKLKNYDGNDANERLFLSGLFSCGGFRGSMREMLSIDKDNENIENEKVEVAECDLYDCFYKTMNLILKNINNKKNRNKIIDKKSVLMSKLVFVFLFISLVFIITIPTIAYGEKEMVFMIILLILFYLPFYAITVFNKDLKGIIKIIVSAFVIFHSGMFFMSFPIADALRSDPLYLIGFIGGLISVILMGVCFKYMPKRTDYGIELFGKIKGFKNFLETVEKEKLEAMVMQDPEYFYNILPYTYVLGISDKWIKKFETIAIQAPNWYDGNTTFSVDTFGTFMNDTMKNATTSMSSSPSSSSGSSGGSSGGGSSGGGSGGGGGGSW